MKKPENDTLSIAICADNKPRRLPYFVCVLSVVFLFQAVNAYSLGDLMLSEEQRRQIDAWREGKSRVRLDSSAAGMGANKSKNEVKINGFYYRNGERRSPRLWVNGERSHSQKLTPSIVVRRIDNDKQTLRLSRPTKDSHAGIKAGQILDVDRGTIKDAHHNK